MRATNTSTPRAGDRGFAMVALLVFLVPLMLLVGSYLQTMSGRQGRLQLEIHEEQAMLATEAGIDHALNEARRGTLLAGVGAEYRFSGELTNKSRYEVICTYLGGNGINDDASPTDTITDMPGDPDEDCFMVTTTGVTGSSRRRVAVYLGFTSYLPPLRGAVTLTNPSMTIVIGGSGRASGRNFNLSGGLVGAGDTVGLSITRPGTIADLTSELTVAEGMAIDGLGGAPSLGTSPPIDIDLLVNYARNGASVVITNRNTNGFTLGSPTAPVVAYRLGELRVTGNTTGYGILVIEGDLRMMGTLHWEGVVICTGEFDCGSGTAEIYGGVILGPSSPRMRLLGTIDLRYSSAGIAMAAGLLGRYVAFNGWQEISTGN